MSKVTYLGSLRTEAVHLQSGNTIITDAPLDNEGKGEAFSPTDLVATALASCILTIMGIVANRSSIKLEGTTAEVVKTMAPNPRRINGIKIRILFNRTFDRQIQSKLENAALSCPVSGSLNKELNETIEFIYP